MRSINTSHYIYAWVFATFCFSKAICNRPRNTPPHLSFDRDWYLTEDEPIGSVVARILVNDVDGDEVKISLGFPSSIAIQNNLNGSSYFYVDRNYRIKLARSLQGMAGQVFLVGVIANDGTIQSKVDAKVTVLWPNEIIKKSPSGLANAFNLGRPPPIRKDPYYPPFTSGPPMLHLSPNTIWKVKNNASVGSIIEKVPANDLSSTYLHYSMYPSDLFRINKETGEVVVSKSLLNKIGYHKLTIKVANKFASITEDVSLQVVPSDPSSSSALDYDKVLKSEVDDDDDHDDEIEEKRKQWKKNKNEPRDKEDQRHPDFSAQRPDWNKKPVITIIEKETPLPGKGTPASSGNETTLGYTVILLIFIFGVLPLIVVIVFFVRRYRLRKKAKAEAKESSVSYSEKRVNYRESFVGGLFSLVGLRKRTESNSYEDTIAIPKVPSRDSNKSNKSRKTSNPIAEKDDWEYSRHKLRFLGILGEGCFGQVWKCEATDLKTEGPSLVAVKTLKKSAEEHDKKDLLQELKVLKGLGYHPNVVSLVGCCTEKDPVFVILEYMIGGKLQTLLRESRADRSYDNLHGTSSTLMPKDLTIFALQIAKGMDFLSRHGIIHRDLAARNVLIGEDKICKVADFGFARDVANNHVYERKSDGKLPLRWMAPESLFDNIFSTKSDVWSFGILLWEIVTLGSTPYPGMSAAEVMKRVKDGYRLEKPDHCRREVYNIMYYCWDVDHNQRPAFAELVKTMETLISTEVDYIRLDNFPDRNYYNFNSEVSTGELL